MDVTGRCQCGAISFRASIDPEKASICHCSDCQHFSGSPYRTSVPAPAAGFKLLSGKPSVYVKTAESGNKRAQGLCGTCGSHVYATAPGDNPEVYMLRIGTLDQGAQLAPRRQIWCRSAMPWATDIKGLPGADKQ
jgi:hypothetical protein